MSRIRRLLCKRSDIADGAARGFMPKSIPVPTGTCHWRFFPTGF